MRFLLAALFIIACVGCAQPGATTRHPSPAPAEPQYAEYLSISTLDHMFGYINAQGEVVIKPRFDTTFDFSEGLGLVTLNDKWGFIDATGEFAVPPKFDNADSFWRGFARVRTGEQWGLLERQTLRVTPLPGTKIQNEPLAVIDTRGTSTPPLLPMETINAERQTRHGFVDRQGNIRIPPVYSNASHFNEGLAVVQRGERIMLIDPTGKIIPLPEEVDDMYWGSYFSEGLALVQAGPNYGYVDRRGRWAIKPTFHGLAQPFSEGLAWVVEPTTGWSAIDGIARRVGRDRAFVIDKSGAVQWTMEGVSDALPFSEGLAAVHYVDPTPIDNETYTDAWGYVNKQGEWVLKPIYGNPGSFRNGIAEVYVGNGELALIRRDGSILWRESDWKEPAKPAADVREH